MKRNQPTFMKKKRILAILSNDSPDLKYTGWEVVRCTDPRKALQWLSEKRFDAVVLSDSLESVDSVEFARQIREKHFIALLRTDVQQLPAESLREQLTQAMEDHVRLENAQKLICGSLEIDLSAGHVSVAGKPIVLTDSEFAVLQLLMKNPGRVFSRENLLEILRGTSWDSANRSMDVLISRLRQKIQDSPKTPQYIQTIRGEGYAYLGQVQIVESLTPTSRAGSRR